jgi:hypothetical protein
MAKASRWQAVRFRLGLGKGMRTLTVAEPGELYERDFYAWTLAQVAELRRLPADQRNNGLDVTNLIDEVADLGKTEKREVRSRVTTIVEHLLKLDHSPAVDPRAGWVATIDRAREDLEDMLTDSLRRDLERHLAVIQKRARRRAARSFLDYGEQEAARKVQAAALYALDDVLRDGWYSTAEVPALEG